MNPGYRRRPSLGEQWRSYGHRPPMARWAARVSLIVGVAVAVVVMLAVGALAVKLLWDLFAWLWATV